VTAIGFPVQAEAVNEEDLQLLRYASAALDAGFPLVAMLQVVRVYGQAIAQIADAEVRLFHLYVHEPLMRSGSSELEVAEQMEDLSKVLLPLASPVIDQIHQRYLHHFIEQDIVGHMESDLDGAAADLGRIRLAIAFADLTGYTRLTEEEGELEALDALERFVEAVEATLPDSARVVKLIGDEVMIVGSDPSALIDWAVGFQRLQSERPLPRIGIHYGEALYRDGDYYGRDVNMASRITARSAGGEVLVTRPVVDHAGPHLEFDRIGEIKLKGFTEPTELFLARGKESDD
jgi:adenylate cyclase